MGDLLTQWEAAAMLRVKPTTLSAWRWQNKGPKYTKAGGKILYHRTHIEEFLQHNTVEPANDKP